MAEAQAQSSEVPLQPRVLADAPALIESVFPAQKVSFEAKTERDAGAGQTLPRLGSYWKGRKPLILVRAIVLGSLLPTTGDPERDLDLYERLMAFDAEGLARRALVQNKLRPADIAIRITLPNPWDYFTFTGAKDAPGDDPTWALKCPFDAEAEGLNLRWRRDIENQERLPLYKQALDSFESYEAKAELCQRPEELDADWLYAPVWLEVNKRYAHLGVDAHSFPELIEQLGILRYGHRPRVGDTFCGGGSIPFEAARLGCDVYASDLNPVACTLTWGAFNIVGAPLEQREEIDHAQRQVAEAVDREVTELEIEHDAEGNRAKVYLYCLEVRCPETGWSVPLAPSWVISKMRNVIARLIPDHNNRCFEIKIISGVSSSEMQEAAKGTVQNRELTYELDGQTYRTPIKTLRGDYRDAEGNTTNRLRRWEKQDFMSRSDDIFQERLYAIQWIDKDTLEDSNPRTFFSSVTDADLERERRVEQIVADNLEAWQRDGLVPDMAIEPGYNTTQPVRERGWTYWHHLFNARQLLVFKTYWDVSSRILDAELVPVMAVIHARILEWNSRLCRWATSTRHENQVNVFSDQALNPFYNYGCRAVSNLENHSILKFPNRPGLCQITSSLEAIPADQLTETSTMWITDPPYADAINYEEITEFFIAWLRKNPPRPFDEWTWDSRRALAIKGEGDDFRRGMVDAYTAMAEHMPDNGMQCVMFTHQDTGVWSDMVGIFWAAGLQVVAAWYIATETTSELKKGGYVQGTVILMLRKRAEGDRPGFKQRILPAVRAEVQRQIESMMHLNDEVEDTHGEPVFNDSDLQMAGYAAALKVLTAYTTIGGEDVTEFALRPRNKGETTVVDEIVQQAAEAANSLLVPEGLNQDTWAKLSGVQRFFLRMMDMETTGASKLDNYQNFAKAFRVEDYTDVMGSMQANKARLKHITEFTSRDLTANTEIGKTWLGQLIIGLQQLLDDVQPPIVIQQFQADMPDFMEIRPLLIDILRFIEHKAFEATEEKQQAVRDAAEVLAARLKNMRALGQ